jgi:hypothetical protein
VLIVDVEDLLRSIAQAGVRRPPRRLPSRSPSRPRRGASACSSWTTRSPSASSSASCSRTRLRRGSRGGRHGRLERRARRRLRPRWSPTWTCRAWTASSCVAHHRDPQLRRTPVMIVSYKDRDEDRRRGLEAGAATTSPRAASTTRRSCRPSSISSARRGS